jgi:hypothetical protein
MYKNNQVKIFSFLCWIHHSSDEETKSRSLLSDQEDERSIADEGIGNTISGPENHGRRGRLCAILIHLNDGFLPDSG